MKQSFVPLPSKMREWWQWMVTKRYIYAVLAGVAIIALVLTVNITANTKKNSPPQPQESTSQLIPLVGALPRALTSAKSLGGVHQEQSLQISISLRLSNTQKLADLIKRQNDPASSQYHKYLQPKEFINQFAPSLTDVNVVRSFLQQSGFNVTNVSSNRLLISAVGTVQQANHAFGVTINDYTLDNRTVFAPQQTPMLPQSLAHIVANVGGLDNVGLAHPVFQQRAHDENSPTNSHVLYPSPRSYSLGPNELRNAYQVTPLINNNGGNGSGQHVAIFEQTTFIPNDLQVYRSQYGLPNAPVNYYAVDGATTVGDSSGTVETDLDTQIVAGLAPNAVQDIYFGPNSNQGTNDIYNLFVARDDAKVMTTSWGTCEPYLGQTELQTLDNIFAEAAAQGQTIFAAAGDTGSDDCFNRDTNKPSGRPPSVDSPGSDPYVLSVGGTTLNYNFSTNSNNGEVVWKDYNASQQPTVTTGGGLSSYFARSFWQVGAGVNNSYENGQREVPDVSANAEQDFSVYCSSVHDCKVGSTVLGWSLVGGTSGSAPLWAGVLADINTDLQDRGKSPMGWANARLYQLFQYHIADHNNQYAMFNDITSGNNDLDYGGTAYQGDYPATPCFDQATGMGSPNAYYIATVALSGATGLGGRCQAQPLNSTELISDGLFEGSTSAWSSYSANGTAALINTNHPHDGAYSFNACGTYGLCDDRIWQNITVPATLHNADLVYWYAANTDFATVGAANTPPCAGHLYVTLATPDGTVFGTAQASCSADTYGYIQVDVDMTQQLAAHTGQTVQIMFRGTANAIGYSNSTTNSISWSVDGVSLSVS